jgi:hypothetical protein
VSPTRQGDAAKRRCQAWLGFLGFDRDHRPSFQPPELFTSRARPRCRSGPSGPDMARGLRTFARHDSSKLASSRNRAYASSTRRDVGCTRCLPGPSPLAEHDAGSTDRPPALGAASVGPARPSEAAELASHRPGDKGRSEEGGQSRHRRCRGWSAVRLRPLPDRRVTITGSGPNGVLIEGGKPHGEGR